MNRFRNRLVSVSSMSANRIPRCTSSTTQFRSASTVLSISPMLSSTSDFGAPSANVLSRNMAPLMMRK